MAPNDWCHDSSYRDGSMFTKLSREGSQSYVLDMQGCSASPGNLNLLELKMFLSIEKTQGETVFAV